MANRLPVARASVNVTCNREPAFQSRFVRAAMGDRGRPIAGLCSAEAGMLTPEAAIGEISAFDVLFAQDLFERSPRPPRFCFALFHGGIALGIKPTRRPSSFRRAYCVWGAVRWLPRELPASITLPRCANGVIVSAYLTHHPRNW